MCNVQVRVNQVFPEAFEQLRDLSLVHVHDSSTANNLLDGSYGTFRHARESVHI